MEKYTISTDSTSDFYASEIAQMNLYVGKLSYIVSENGAISEYLDDFQSYEDYTKYYDKLKSGGIAKTSILNLQAHIDLFTKMAKDGVKNAIHITQAMGLSPTLNNALKAIEEVKKEYPDINFKAIESNTTTVAEGNLVKVAYALREQGLSMDENIEMLETLKNQIQHFIIADDLKYLCRGGRVSQVSATIGSILSIKPIIEFTKDGKLEVVRKESGVKKAYKSVITEVKQNFTFHEKFANPIIVHTNNEAGAVALADMFESEFGVRPEIRIMGPIIGAHVGPGAVALTFISNEKRKH